MNRSLNKLYLKYLGSWVSISEDYSKVYAHSKDLDDLVAEIKKRKAKKGLIMKVPERKYSTYVG